MAACFGAPKLIPQDGGFRDTLPALSHGKDVRWEGYVHGYGERESVAMAHAVPRIGIGLLVSRGSALRVARKNSWDVHRSVALFGGHDDTVLLAQHMNHGRYRGRMRRGCQCVGSPIAEMGSMAVALEWGPVVEQLMLVTSVALAYIAGIATPAKPALVKLGRPLWFPNNSSDKEAVPSQQSERCEKAHAQSLEMEAHEGDLWSTTEAKLAAALLKIVRVERDAEIYEDKDGAIRSPVLSLQAIGAGPRLRLLLGSLGHLRKEVECISETSKLLPPAQWSKLSLDILCRSVEPICRNWLATEPGLVNTDGAVRVEESTGDSIEEKNEAGDLSETVNVRRSIRQGRNLVLNYLQRSGKAELYMDLMFFLRFKTMRPGSCCDHSMMSKHVGNALEDLVVAVADGAAAIYLGRSSEMGGREESDWPILVRSSIKSTRALERFRNEVALRSWLQQNFSSVVAMFEDRFELWTVQKISSVGRDVGKGSQSEQERAQAKDEDFVQEWKLTRMELPARRSKELRALTGWRYFYSLYLEFSDIVGPLLQGLVSKLGDGVSFLLVRLIGRSLGLIYQGIRQSVRWSSK